MPIPTVYVTYHDPATDRITIVAVETALSFRVFRAACLVEGVELPGGRSVVLPACLRGLSLDAPDEKAMPKPTAAKRKREPAAASS